LTEIDAAFLIGSAFNLGPAERKIVDDAIREVCAVRVYQLFALSVRTNHVHLVVKNCGKVERMMDSFKAYSTRALRVANRIDGASKPGRGTGALDTYGRRDTWS